MDGKAFTRAEKIHYDGVFGEMKQRQREVEEKGRKHRTATPPPAPAGDGPLSAAWDPVAILPPQGILSILDHQTQCLT